MFFVAKKAIFRRLKKKTKTKKMNIGYRQSFPFSPPLVIFTSHHFTSPSPSPSLIIIISKIFRYFFHFISFFFFLLVYHHSFHFLLLLFFDFDFLYIVGHLLTFLGESAQKQGTTANIDETFKDQLSYSRPLSPSSDDYCHSNTKFLSLGLDEKWIVQRTNIEKKKIIAIASLWNEYAKIWIENVKTYTHWKDDKWPFQKKKNKSIQIRNSVDNQLMPPESIKFSTYLDISWIVLFFYLLYAHSVSLHKLLLLTNIFKRKKNKNEKNKKKRNETKR